MAQAGQAEKRGDVAGALRIYGTAEAAETNQVDHLCELARRYCDLTFQTNLAAAGVLPKDLVRRAVDCSLQAVRVDGSNATAHACLAVAYAKSCAFADIKTQLAYSKLFKQEAERALALNPREDIAYYLLGRWNYEIAHVGFLSRAYVRVVYGGLPPASNAAAIGYFKQAVALAPERILHHAGLAMAYAAMGNTAFEREELKLCDRLKPSGPEDEEAQQEARKKLAALANR